MTPLDSEHLTEEFLKGLAGLTGLSYTHLKTYSESNSFFNILDHPQLISTDPRHLKKIEMIKDLIKCYNTLRKMEKAQIALNSPINAGNYFVSLLEGKRDKELLLASFLDAKLKVIETQIITEGTVDQAPVYPREILERALNSHCKAIMVSHNHPSGDPNPSREDIEMTKRLCNIFDPIGIDLIDHIVVGGTNYYSIKEHYDYIFEMNGSPNYEPIYLGDLEP